jgi:hypothetical protein
MPPESTPPLILKPGEYRLALHVWMQPAEKPVTQLHELTVNDETFAGLERKRLKKKSDLSDVTKDRQLSLNSHLTSYVAASLLGLQPQ